MRSVVHDRAESAGAQQLAATGPQVPQARIGRTVRPAVQVLGEHRREQADVATRLPIVWSSVIGRSRPLRSWNARESPM